MKIKKEKRPCAGLLANLFENGYLLSWPDLNPAFQTCVMAEEIEDTLTFPPWNDETIVWMMSFKSTLPSPFTSLNPIAPLEILLVIALVTAPVKSPERSKPEPDALVTVFAAVVFFAAVDFVAVDFVAVDFVAVFFAAAVDFVPVDFSAVFFVVDVAI